MLRVGTPPYLECSSKGDKRFSAFYATLKNWGWLSIEEIYQAAKVFEDGRTNLHWREAKGLKPVNVEEVRMLYSQLWDEYFEENPKLLEYAATFTGFSDIFGKVGSTCQAVEIARNVRNYRNGQCSINRN